MRSTGSSAKKPVIIITDDRRVSRQMIRNILNHDRYELLEASNGREALELCKTDQPDLVLLDIVMPVMDGLETCIRIKQMDGGHLIPVLIFTAHSEGLEVEKAFRAGASDFINKPINPEELRHRVRRLLYLRKLEIERKVAEDKLQSSYEKIKVLSRKILKAYEEERVRLSRELHDEVGMSLTTLKLNLQLLNKELLDSGVECDEQMSLLITSVSDLLNAIRSKAVFLRPPSLQELGLNIVIENMVNEISRHTGLSTELQVSGSINNLPVEVETVLYRCVQESLTNVVRHASAENVLVKLILDEQMVSLTVTDDGIGFDRKAGYSDQKQIGLKGMKERVALLNGVFNIESEPGKGTEIQVYIPRNRYETGKK
jgi:signal transduction histidine kinase